MKGFYVRCVCSFLFSKTGKGQHWKSVLAAFIFEEQKKSYWNRCCKKISFDTYNPVIVVFDQAIFHFFSPRIFSVNIDGAESNFPSHKPVNVVTQFQYKCRISIVGWSLRHTQTKLLTNKTNIYNNVYRKFVQTFSRPIFPNKAKIRNVNKNYMVFKSSRVVEFSVCLCWKPLYRH